MTAVEIDPATAAVARRALGEPLSGAAGDPPSSRRSSARVVVGDGLDPSVLGDIGPADLVVANPPFLGQLSATTARSSDRRRQVVAWHGPAAGGYVDDAAVFVLAALRHLLADDGVGAFILPESLLATSSAAAVRRAVAGRADVSLAWRDVDGAFPGVPTCAILVRPRPGTAGADLGSAHPAVARIGAGVGASPLAGTPADVDADTGADERWSHLLADGEPEALGTGRTIGDVATATADFRDAYYLVARHVAEADGETAGEPGAEPGDEPGADAGDDVPVVPVGLIDPARCLWGRTPVRFAKQRWSRPVARGLPADFLAARLGPKVLVATQSRVLESLVDIDGRLLPTTPAITVRTEQPWHVSAALCSPVLTQAARRRHAGAGLSREALRLSASQVLALPLPATASRAWDDAADLHRRAHDPGLDVDARHDLLVRAGRLMWEAFASPVDERAQEQWEAALPRR